MSLLLKIIIILIIILLISYIIINFIQKIKFGLVKHKLYNNLNDDNLKKYIKTLIKVSIKNSPDSWREIRSVFYQINNSQKISFELKKQLYNILIKKGCYLNDIKIRKNKDELERERKIRIIRSGQEGEKTVKYSLKWLPKEYKVLHNVNLGHRVESQEFDNIIIGPNGIFHLETKNEGGSNGCKIIIDNVGNWHRIDDENELSMTSPIAQLDRHDLVLKDTIRDNFGDKNFNIVGVIVLSNKYTLIEGVENCQVPVLKVDNLVRYITSYKSEKIITDDEIELIFKKINEIKLEPKVFYDEDLEFENIEKDIENQEEIIIKKYDSIYKTFIVRVVLILFILFCMPILVAILS